VRLLAFSDLHRDLEQAARLVEASAGADVVLAAGDFASTHNGLEETIEALCEIDAPTILVPGNNETEDALRQACAGWSAACVLHGAGTELKGVDFFGLGAGVPRTPWDWSFDLTEDEASERLAGAAAGGVLVLHSPPFGHVDVTSDEEHVGSRAILAAIEQKRPRLAVCGHIHDSWGERSRLGATEIANLGPSGAWFEL
jgi:Icc-related predicted phosphoesterase